MLIVNDFSYMKVTFPRNYCSKRKNSTMFVGGEIWGSPMIGIFTIHVLDTKWLLMFSEFAWGKCGIRIVIVVVLTKYWYKEKSTDPDPDNMLWEVLKTPFVAASLAAIGKLWRNLSTLVEPVAVSSVKWIRNTCGGLVFTLFQTY